MRIAVHPKQCRPQVSRIVSGKPYISVNSATMKAENAPKERQSRPVFGLVKRPAPAV